MLEPPSEDHRKLVARLAEVDVEYSRAQWRSVGFVWVAALATLPLVLVQDVRDWTTVGLFYFVVLAGCVLSFANVRMVRPRVAVLVACNIALAVVLERVTGPFMMVPVVLCTTLSSWMAYPTNIDRPIVPVAFTAVAYVLPMVLEWLHLAAPTWSVSHGSVTTTTSVIQLDGTASRVFLIVGTFACIVIGGGIARSIAARRRELQRTLETQAWHLRNLLPM